MDDEHYMRLALREAEKAIGKGDFPIGCIIVLNNRIISSAHNEVFSKSDRLAHAELTALKNAQSTLMGVVNEATLFTTYEPCPMCFGASVQSSSIRRIVYGINLDNSGATHLRESLPPFYQGNERYFVEITGRVLEDECKEVFLRGEPVKRMIEKGHLKI